MEKRFVIKIVAGKSQALVETMYFRDSLTMEMLSKWRWYFEYREALYKVQNPRHYCRLDIIAYDYVPPVEEQDKKLKDRIKSKKATITKHLKSLMLAKEEWMELFPIEDDFMYKRCVQKINRLKFELRALEIQYKDFLNETAE